MVKKMVFNENQNVSRYRDGPEDFEDFEEEESFEIRFPNHKIESGKLKELTYFKVKKPETDIEAFEFIFKNPVLVIFGDFGPAIYNFPQLEHLADLRHMSNEEMESYCESENHDDLYNQALQFFFDEVERQSKIEKAQKTGEL